jgi:DNA helicase-2/ATP-dependent DNA helicase PcrA
MKDYEQAMSVLNTRQKQAVETLDGPVMVVAGPGTGKTQVLTLRIAHILEATDTPPSGILCLTFTRSGVTAMRERLEHYIGSTALDIQITTFHSFAISLVEKHYALLDFVHMPKLLEDRDAILLIDELLETGDWEYISPKTDRARYFYDLKSLLSLLKRERISPVDFQTEIDHEIDTIKNDPENISTRGPSKGQLKKEIEKKIDALLRTREIVTFYTTYETLKKERSFMDYDDCLEYALLLVEEYEDIRSDILENYLYVLVDEHQDSNNVQNSFLKAVWAHKDNPVERPNIFVVGDDRQLIYGFAGAHIDYFTDFSMMFGKAVCIVLTENYRSTKPILQVADELLKSSVTSESLTSNRKGSHALVLREFDYTRDEIIGAGIYFKKLLDQGVDPRECTLLVPKNRHVRNAVQLFRSLGLPVVSEQSVSLLELSGVESMLLVLELITNPCNGMLIGELVLDSTSRIAPLVGHTFIKNTKNIQDLSIEQLIQTGNKDGLFADDNPIGNLVSN